MQKRIHLSEHRPIAFVLKLQREQGRPKDSLVLKDSLLKNKVGHETYEVALITLTAGNLTTRRLKNLKKFSFDI